jgi:hypothetical protein
MIVLVILALGGVIATVIVLATERPRRIPTR